MKLQDRIRYGAAELKRVYNRNLGYAFSIAIGIHLLLIGLYMYDANVGSAGEKPHIGIGVQLSPLKPPTAASTEPPPLIPPEVINPMGGGGVNARAGNPIPVPNAVIAPDFAPITQVSVATPAGGDGTGFRAGQDVELGRIDVGEQVVVKEVEPGPDDFIPDATEPTLDYDALQQRVRYPEIAEKNGIEGRVVVRVLVDRFGKPQKYRIDHSDNRLLDLAAIEAVMATQFTPGVQNGVSVQLWVSVPIIFTLP